MSESPVASCELATTVSYKGIHLDIGRAPRWVGYDGFIGHEIWAGGQGPSAQYGLRKFSKSLSDEVHVEMIEHTQTNIKRLSEQLYVAA